LSATAHRILRHRRAAKVAPLATHTGRKVLAQGVSGHPPCGTIADHRELAVVVIVKGRRPARTSGSDAGLPNVSS
jgi:hypothetical protein